MTERNVYHLLHQIRRGLRIILSRHVPVRVRIISPLYLSTVTDKTTDCIAPRFHIETCNSSVGFEKFRQHTDALKQNQQFHHKCKFWYSSWPEMVLLGALSKMFALRCWHKDRMSGRSSESMKSFDKKDKTKNKTRNLSVALYEPKSLK